MNTELHVDLIFNMKIRQSDEEVLHEALNLIKLTPAMSDQFSRLDLERLIDMRDQFEQLVTYTGE